MIYFTTIHWIADLGIQSNRMPVYAPDKIPSSKILELVDGIKTNKIMN